jgi:hypothetical protein
MLKIKKIKWKDIKEAKEYIQFTENLGIILFAIGAFGMIVSEIQMIFFPDLMLLLQALFSGAVFTLGLGLVSFAVSSANTLIRRMPERWKHKYEE